LQTNPWNDRAQIHAAFERVFDRFRGSILVVSYRSDGVPSPVELVELLKRHKPRVRVAHYGRYQYALSKNSTSGEMLLIAE
jgi:adenine-specific DNA-methyltransferase